MQSTHAPSKFDFSMTEMLAQTRESAGVRTVKFEAAEAALTTVLALDRSFLSSFADYSKAIDRDDFFNGFGWYESEKWDEWVVWIDFCQVLTWKWTRGHAVMASSFCYFCLSVPVVALGGG